MIYGNKKITQKPQFCKISDKLLLYKVYQCFNEKVNAFRILIPVSYMYFGAWICYIHISLCRKDKINLQAYKVWGTFLSRRLPLRI